ncbi:MAG TPA: Hsp20/alpha crystallin family protein [Nitrospiria bacterium]
MLKTNEKETREVAPWRPFTELTRMEREMERMFEDFMGKPLFGLRWPERLRFPEFKFRGPAIEIYEEKDDLVLKAELPGMTKEDLDIQISDTYLTLKGEKKAEKEMKEKGHYYSERTYGAFERTVEIPRYVLAEKAVAHFKDGVLKIRLPKTEEAKRKETKIKIE